MIIVASVPAAIGLMVAGIVLLGLWPVVWHCVEARGRRPAHVFLDYAATYLAIATATAMTLGQLGPAAADTPRFTDQLRQPNGRMAAFALAGGVCLALGDLAIQYATALLGLTVGPALLNALTVIVGVILAYFLDGGINRPSLVFPGMACATVAIALGAAAHLLNQRHQRLQQQQQQQQQPQQQAQQQAGGGCDGSCRSGDSSCKADASCKFDTSAGGCWDPRDVELQSQSCHQQQQQPPAGVKSRNIRQLTADGRAASSWQQQHAESTAASSVDQPPQQPQRQRSIQTEDGTSSWLGLGIVFAGGIVYGLFLPAFQIAANDPFSLLGHDGTPPLTLYCAFFYFSIGFAAASAAVNVCFLYRPPFGVQRSCIKSYLRDNGSGRWLSIVSGVLAALGDLTQFIGGQVAGYAACYLVMAYPVVSALFGMLRFRELQRGSRWALACAVGQVGCYAASVGLLAASAELRVGHSSNSS